jgi:HlyD family secretion protein
LLRFSAFNQRTTPELIGTVESISADVTTDDRTGVRFYTARVEVSANQLQRLGTLSLCLECLLKLS